MLCYFTDFGKLPRKVGKLPIVPNLTLTDPDLTQAGLLLREMAHKDTFFHFSDLDLWPWFSKKWLFTDIICIHAKIQDHRSNRPIRRGCETQTHRHIRKQYIWICINSNTDQLKAAIAVHTKYSILMSFSNWVIFECVKNKYPWILSPSSN